MTATIIIVTLDRPDSLRECLRCVELQEPAPAQVVVVDSSTTDESSAVVDAFPGVEYARHVGGAGKMTASRNLGLLRAHSDTIVFIDDDSYAAPGWLAEILDSFTSGVAAVGGRALRGEPGEDREGIDEIGRLSDDGLLTGFFAADPGQTIEVDHVMGCNMAFSRDVLQTLGGMREQYTGISGVREDTDICLRIRQLGGRILFNPRALVHHAGAPQVKGRRFDWRYEFYAERNHCLLLVTNFGLTDRMVRRYLSRSVRDRVKLFRERVVDGRAPAAAVRFLASCAGTVSGLASGVAVLLSAGRDPVRRDAGGLAVSASLRGTAPRDLAP